ncbi:hypothetical protein EW146_g1219 [Bondarzewia mesenterica]|uniref:Uncharacterized protein n=1 Tax=Bondarzewia mesenterica TaxID=1095465 RepID=A0A4S4M603_9AGAM|nr:hypothetical protein EW146_g1219 [Bondarzewia mesenterica]
MAGISNYNPKAPSSALASFTMELRNQKVLPPIPAATSGQRLQPGMGLRNKKVLLASVPTRSPRAKPPSRPRQAKAAYGARNADNIIAGMSLTGEGVHLRFIGDLVDKEVTPDAVASGSSWGKAVQEPVAGPSTAPPLQNHTAPAPGPRISSMERSGRAEVGEVRNPAAAAVERANLQVFISQPRVSTAREDIEEGIRRAKAQRQAVEQAIRERVWEELRRNGHWEMLEKVQADYERLQHPPEDMSELCPTERVEPVAAGMEASGSGLGAGAVGQVHREADMDVDRSPPVVIKVEDDGEDVVMGEREASPEVDELAFDQMMSRCEDDLVQLCARYGGPRGSDRRAVDRHFEALREIFAAQRQHQQTKREVREDPAMLNPRVRMMRQRIGEEENRGLYGEWAFASGPSQP